jgi:hypothetical protein
MRSGKPATPAEIDGVLTAVEEQIEAKGTADPRDLGFWKVVGTVKRDPTLTDRFADRIGAIDQAVFMAWAPLTTPLVAGTALGLGLIGMF